jgi:hypothetical protein
MEGKVRIQNGEVVSVETTTFFKGLPFSTITVEKNENGYYTLFLGDPEGAEFQASGTLHKVLKGLHEKVVEQYLNLFSLENPTLEDIEKAGFPNHEVINEARSDHSV